MEHLYCTDLGSRCAGVPQSHKRTARRYVALDVPSRGRMEQASSSAIRASFHLEKETRSTLFLRGRLGCTTAQLSLRSHEQHNSTSYTLQLRHALDAV